VDQPATVQFILQAWDDAEPSLVRYRRAVVT